MTDQAPKGFERVVNGKPTTTDTFWCLLWWPMEKNSHGEALPSPKFEDRSECAGWMQAHKIRRGMEAQVGMFQRVSREGGDYEDIPLHTDDAPLPDPERLHRLVGKLKAMLAVKKRELDGGRPAGKPYSSVGTFNPIERPATYEEAYPDDPTP